MPEIAPVSDARIIEAKIEDCISLNAELVALLEKIETALSVVMSDRDCRKEIDEVMKYSMGIKEMASNITGKSSKLADFCKDIEILVDNFNKRMSTVQILETLNAMEGLVKTAINELARFQKQLK